MRHASALPWILRLGGLLLIACTLEAPVARAETSPLKVHFIDVDQGDGCK